MSYVLIDHGLTPFSPIEEIETWIERVERMIDKRQNNNELREALEELERLRDMVNER